MQPRVLDQECGSQSCAVGITDDAIVRAFEGDEGGKLGKGDPYARR